MKKEMVITLRQFRDFLDIIFQGAELARKDILADVKFMLGYYGIENKGKTLVSFSLNAKEVKVETLKGDFLFQRDMSMRMHHYLYEAANKPLRLL